MQVVKNCGIWLREDGTAWADEVCTKQIEPSTDVSGYKYIPDTLLNAAPSSFLLDISGEQVRGKYLHRMMVFSFGDKNGRPYQSAGIRSIIDHVNMNHSDNRVENLQLVSNGINLFRAYYKTGRPELYERFNTYYESLSDSQKMILECEIKLDLEGKY